MNAHDELGQRFWEQFHRIKDSLAAETEPIRVAAKAGVVYEKAHVLARAEDAEEVGRLIYTRLRRSADVNPNHETGLCRVRIGDDGPDDDGDDWGVDEALELTRDARRADGKAMLTRNHIVSIANVNCCPADEPVPAALPLLPAAPVGSFTADRTVDVLVVDTGLVIDFPLHPWMTDVTPVEPAPKIMFEPGDPFLKQYVGHGTFIASLIKTVAPNATVRVSGALAGIKAGALPEHTLAEALADLVRDGWPDIISLSAGTLVQDQYGLAGLETFVRRLAEEKTLLVAAAGNNGSDQPFWPAAYAADPDLGRGVASVGALRHNEAKDACFTSYGDWVKVYAPGERLVAAFTGSPDNPVPYRYQHSTFYQCQFLHGSDAYATCSCQQPEHLGVLSGAAVAGQTTFTGLATWSGTSFSTPIVAAMVVDWMQRHDEAEPRKAFHDLMATAGTALVRGVPRPALMP
ncbi:S8/S53 family peptidase [Streptosporangiaceae bacterium NEAU-GS5]|nr:S8/S53 family peptidase [Streptosporangiaceae bacterium NEAU-GS5]